MNNYWQALNEYYDKAYVISVKAAEDRRQRFTEQFAGLNFSFFFGADKKDLSIDELVDKNIYSEELTIQHHRYSKTMMLGEIACALSHRRVYEDMLRNNYDRVLIFEDDAVPDHKNLKLIPEILSEVPPDCELLMWGWGKNDEPGFSSSIKKVGYHLQHTLGLLKWDHKIISKLFAKPYSAHLKTAGFHDYAHAYGITKPCAEKLLQMQTPVQYIADNLLAYAVTRNVVTGYIAHPAVILHDNLPDGTGRDSYIR